MDLDLEDWFLTAENPKESLAAFVDQIDGEDFGQVQGRIAPLFRRLLVPEFDAPQLELISPFFLEIVRKMCLNASEESSKSAHESNELFLLCLDICRRLAGNRTSRFVRRSASAALHLLLGVAHLLPEMNSAECGGRGRWEEFLMLLDALEEPQQHLIVPLLPKLDSLLLLGFSPLWLRLLFEKAIRHPNGWIRVFALEKVVSPVPFPQSASALPLLDSQFTLAVLLPALADLDPFWRLLEKGTFHVFVANLTQRLAQFVDKSGSDEQKASFALSLLRLLSSIEPRWTCHSLHILSELLYNVARCFESQPFFRPGQHFHLWRSLFGRVSEIPFVPLRIVTAINFLEFYIRLYSWSDLSEIWQFPLFLSRLPSLTNGFSLERREDFVSQVLLNFVNYIASKWPSLLTGLTADGIIRAFLSTFDSSTLAPVPGAFEAIFAAFCWHLSPLSSAAQLGLLAGLESLAVESIEAGQFQRTDQLLSLWVRQPPDLCSVDAFLDILREHLSVRIFTQICLQRADNGQIASDGQLNTLLSALELMEAKRRRRVAAAEEDSPTHSCVAELALCALAFLDQNCSDLLGCHSALFDSLTRCLNWELDFSSSDAPVPFPLPAHLLGLLSTRATLIWREFFQAGNTDLMPSALWPKVSFLLVSFRCQTRSGQLTLDDQLVPAAISQLADWALSARHFHERTHAFQLIEFLLDQLHIDSLSSSAQLAPSLSSISGMLRSLFVLTQEERKCRNFLPSVQHFLRIALGRNVLRFVDREEEKDQLCELIRSQFDDLLAQSQLNVPLSTVLAEQLFHSRQWIPATLFVPHLLELATFGPIAKRDGCLLKFIFESIYNDNFMPKKGYVGLLPRQNADLFHLAAKQTRMFAISTLLLFALRPHPSINKNAPFINSLIRELISRSEQWARVKSSSFGLSLAHRQRTRLSQLMVLLVGFISDEELCDLLFDHCVRCALDSCQQYSIRLLVEWTLSRLCALHSRLFECFLLLEHKFARERVASICSWINVLFHHFSSPCPQRNPPTDSQLQLFLRHIIPWTTAQNFSVRCSAIAALKLIWCRHLSTRPKMDDQFLLVQRIAEFDVKVSAGSGSRIVDSLCHDFYFAHFDPVAHFSMQALFEIFPAKTGLPEEELIQLDLLQKHFGPFFGSSAAHEKLTDFLHSIDCPDQQFSVAESLVYSNLVRNQSSIPSWTFSADSQTEQLAGKGTSPVHTLDGNLNPTFVPETGESGLPEEVQRKLNIIGSELSAGQRSTDSDLIVVASLITKAANLGGLCRTCEIFGVATLCLSSGILVDNVDFKALSMSSENWQNVLQVKADDLPAYLRGMRARGYQCVAAEQTTRSVPLQDYRFPRHCLLLLGDEKEGIPPELFQFVDSTVEITQLGRTRSLNVHVSAALCIHQFASQWLMPRTARANTTQADE